MLAAYLQVRMAEVANKSGDYPGARDAATISMQAYGESPAPEQWIQLGIAQAGLGDLPAAATTLERAVAALDENPAGPLAIANAAWALCGVAEALGEPTRAEALARRAREAFEEARRTERVKEIEVWLSAD